MVDVNFAMKRSSWRLGVSRAEQSQRQRGNGRATVLIAVLIYPCSFAGVSCDYESLRLEGEGVDGNGRCCSTGVGKSVLLRALILENHVKWRLGVDKASFAFVRLVKLGRKIMALRFQLAVKSVGSWERESRLLY